MFTVQQWKFIRLIGRRAVPFSASAQPADRTGRPRSDALARTNRSNERRRFLGPVLAFVLAWVPLAANAQAEKPPRVGLLGSYSPTSPLYEAFRQGLRELGYVEGRNLISRQGLRTANWIGSPSSRASLPPEPSTTPHPI